MTVVDEEDKPIRHVTRCLYRSRRGRLKVKTLEGLWRTEQIR